MRSIISIALVACVVHSAALAASDSVNGTDTRSAVDIPAIYASHWPVRRGHKRNYSMAPSAIKTNIHSANSAYTPPDHQREGYTSLLSMAKLQAMISDLQEHPESTTLQVDGEQLSFTTPPTRPSSPVQPAPCNSPVSPQARFINNKENLKKTASVFAGLGARSYLAHAPRQNSSNSLKQFQAPTAEAQNDIPEETHTANLTDEHGGASSSLMHASSCPNLFGSEESTPRTRSVRFSLNDKQSS